MASYVIEHTKSLLNDNPRAGTAYYCCHYSHAQNEAAPFLRWVIGQLCRQARWVPSVLEKLHKQGCDPGISDLENALKDVTPRFKVVYLVIDAVDESADWEDLLRVIATLSLDERFRNVQILATSRLYYDIEHMLSDISTPLSMSNSLVKDNIRAVIRARLASSRLLRRLDHMFPEIENALVTGAQGM
jgi:hypothetical protein